MTRKATNSNPLADRLAELGIDAAELAQIVGRPIETVDGWLADGPDADAEILTRFLADDADALRRVERVRTKQSQPLRGRDDWASQGVDVPYAGGFAGADAGAPA